MKTLYSIYTKIRTIRSFYLRALIGALFRLFIISWLPLLLVARIFIVILTTLLMKGVSLLRTKKSVKLRLGSFLRISIKNVCVLTYRILFSRNLFHVYFSY